MSVWYSRIVQSGSAWYAHDPTVSGSAAPTGSIEGQIKVWNGTSWDVKPVKVWNGSTWVTKPLKYWNGSAWVLTSYTI